MQEYITTFSKIHFTPLAPKQEDIIIEDIAHALSLMTRANGHFREFYSVAQHSMDCANLARAEGRSGREVMACLMHDASEAYMSDVPRPFKHALPSYVEAEEKLLEMIYEKFLGSSLSEEEQKLVKIIDDDLLYYDLKVLLGETPVGEAPNLKIELDYTVQPFEKVEAQYLKLYERFNQ